MVTDLSVGLTKAQAAEAPKLFQLNRTLGPDTVVKLLVVVLRAFVDSLRVPDKPDANDLMYLADDLAQTYTHDSLKDIVLALKEARLGGTKFYQSLDISTLKRLIMEYFDRKAGWLHSHHDDAKARGTSIEQAGVAQLRAVAPALAQALTLRIDPGHPNAETLRRKLSLTKNRQQRGLIDEATAEQQRADVAAAAQRKPRADWQPGKAAQERIDKANRREDKRLAEKYAPRPTDY